MTFLLLFLTILFIIFYAITDLAPILFIVFLILKFCNIIAWSWWLICLPIILLPILIIITGIIKIGLNKLIIKVNNDL